MTIARWHKVRADLRVGRARSVLVVLSLAVGTLAVGAMHLASGTVDASFEGSFLASNPPSTMLRTGPMSDDVVDAVASHLLVGELDARRLVEVQVSGADIARRSLELVAMPDLTASAVARIEPDTGTWPPGPGEVVLERASSPELGLAVGDEIQLAHRDRAPVDVEVVGTAYDVYEIAPMLGGPTRAYVSMETMGALTGTDVLDALYLRAPDDPLATDRAAEVAAAVRDDVLTPARVPIAYAALHDPSEHLGAHTLRFLVTAMQLMSALGIVIAVALVTNTVVAMLAQQRRQIGVMKAVGASSGQLTTQYLAHVLLLAGAALVLAVPGALVLGRALAGFLAGMANFDVVPLGVPWSTLGLQVLVAIVLPVLVVLVVVRRSVRTTVHEILTDRGITSAVRSPRLRLPVSRPTALACRNALRNRPRLALTILTIGLCGAVIVGVLSTRSSLGSLSDQIAGYLPRDLQVRLNEAVDVDEVRAVVETDPDVTAVEGWLTTQAFRIRPDGSENGNINLVGLPTDSSEVEPTLLDGRWLRTDDDHAVVVNTHLVDEEPDVGVGDDVVLEVEGHRRTWRVVGISSTTLMGPGAYVGIDDLGTTIERPGQATVLAVSLDDGATPADVADRLDGTLRAAGLDVGGVSTHAELRADFEGMVSIATLLFLLVGAVLGVVAVVGVAGTMTLAVLEQTREVGVLRTLGASDRAVRRLLVAQGLAIAALGGVVGVVLSLPVAALLEQSLETGLLEAEVPSGFSWLGVAVWIPVALLIGALGASRPARVAARLTVHDTLAYE